MNYIPSALDLNRLFERLEGVRYWRDSTGVEMALTQFSDLDPDVATLARDALDEIEAATGKKAVSMMLNRLPARTSVPYHTDSDPRDLERWHLPITTNSQAMFWEQSKDDVFAATHMRLGYWWGPVPYTKRHRVTNDGPTERIHLVVDLGR